MERERAEYLPPIPRSRWEFPWLGLWAVVLLGMAGAGIWLHVRTGDAWTQRFIAAKGDPAAAPVETVEPVPEPIQDLAQIRLMRERAEAEVRRQHQEAANLRCINGMTFRRIPGGWENIPDRPC